MYDNSTREVTRLHMIKCQGSDAKKKYPEFWYGMDDDCGLEESKKASRRR